ncbi:MAG: AsnC family protein [Actinophytocola sp.]|uniref:AsnC family protein n=1 Tax=Actinophytocola sp. TaxID=1872138 RepID=UPI0013286612|nr:AsnC family protein [Actinophytocola sp.]MPZ82883.1 AsnC family protein [Actinophytocola sp.]
MVATDPVDARLLGVVAEMGRAAVHEVAARMGMDPREVASRLVALSAIGLPLLVGVECDPARLRAAAAAAMAQAAPSAPYGYPQQPQYQAPPSGPVPMPMPYQGPGPVPPPGPSGPHSVQSGPHSVPSGPHQVPSGPVQMGYQPRTGPPSAPFPAQTGPPSIPFPTPQPDAPMTMWGPPQTSTWARGDQPPQDVTQPTVRAERPEGEVRQGKVGAMLQTEGLEGERLAIQLVEVVDPADYLFTAAGYRLQEGERSVVVHTELTNRGSVAFQSLPDLYLVLVTPDGKTISKAPVSLSSRPPHRIGVPPGETAGGHTVYVVPEQTEVTSVRWSPRPDEESRTLNWTVED